MQHTATTVDDIFRPFDYSIDLSEITHATCIAHQEFGGGDELSAVYEVYARGKPRYFAVSAGDQPQEVEDETDYIKNWAESKDITLLSKSADGCAFLFELIEPYGIRFE